MSLINKNIKLSHNQWIQDMHYTFTVSIDWTIIKTGFSPVAIIEWHNTSQTQLIYIRGNPEFDIYFYEFKNEKLSSQSFPKVKGLKSGVGYEIIVHLFRDGLQYLRILDFPNLYDVHFKWVGDIPLNENENIYRAFSQLIPVGYDEKNIRLENNEIKTYNYSVYLISKFNSYIDEQSKYSLVTCQYSDLNESDRHLKKNFTFKSQNIPFERYLSGQEILDDWKCLIIQPIEIFRYHQIPKAITVIKLQYTSSGHVKFKISLKALPPLTVGAIPDYDHADDWLINPENY